MTTSMPKPEPMPRRIADNQAAWPSLSHLLAAGAGCDCQMLAISIADRLEVPPPPPVRGTARR